MHPSNLTVHKRHTSSYADTTVPTFITWLVTVTVLPHYCNLYLMVADYYLRGEEN